MISSILGRRAASLIMILLSSFTACLAEEDTQQLLQEAVESTGMDRYDAIDDLGEQGEQPSLVIPVLQELLSDDDPQVQWRSARSLGDFEGAAADAADALAELLASPEPSVQYHAAVALARIGKADESTIDALVSAAIGPDARVARAAIASLRHLKAPPRMVAGALKQAMASDDQAVVVHAMETLVNMGSDSAPILIEALKNPRTAYVACAAIEHAGANADATVPALIELLADTKHSHLQVQALLALASIGPPASSASDQIVVLLENSQDATVQVAAAYALGAIGAVDSDAALRAAAKKEGALLRMITAWSLAKIHPDDEPLQSAARTILQEGLKSQDPAVRSAAEEALASHGPSVDAADAKQ